MVIQKLGKNYVGIHLYTYCLLNTKLLIWDLTSFLYNFSILIGIYKQLILSISK